MPNAIVIGAGIGGIATALRLNKIGYDVTVLEANSYPGGKLYTKDVHGYRFDLGPSLFTMPHLVDELFTLFDIDPKSFFEYSKKEVICNYFWEDGTTFSANGDSDVFIKEAAKTFGESESHLKSYVNSNTKKYDLTSSLFLEKSLHKASTYLSVDTIKAILQIGKLDVDITLNALNEKTFQSAKLVQLFNRFATYNGSSPYQTPGIMSMIPHLEMNYGTFFPKGGMVQISKSLYELAVRQGVTFKFNEKVNHIKVEQNKAIGVASTKRDYMADITVSNMDIFPRTRTL
jgi:phytoene desaturase